MEVFVRSLSFISTINTWLSPSGASSEKFSTPTYFSVVSFSFGAYVVTARATETCLFTAAIAKLAHTATTALPRVQGL